MAKVIAIIIWSLIIDESKNTFPLFPAFSNIEGKQRKHRLTDLYTKKDENEKLVFFLGIPYK